VTDYESKLRVAEFKQELVRDGGSTGNDIRSGLEVRGEKPETPKETSEIDPGWRDFTERTQATADVEGEVWQTVAAQGEELGLRQAIQVYENAMDDADIIKAALYAAGTEGYGAFLQTVSEQDGPEYAAGLAQTVSNVLAETSAMARNEEFGQQMRASEEANVQHAQQSLAELAARRGMSAGEVEDVAKAYQSATGDPLRYDMLAILPEHRAAFLDEVAVQHEAGVRAARMQKFAASLFAAPSTDIADGLRIKDGVPRDLPPILLDEGYALHRATQAVRREDEARASRPSRTADDEIKRQLVEPERTDWRSALTTDDGRPTSVGQIMERDPDSTLNVEKRAHERAAMKLASITGARIR
jgi:hypothetical protein